MERLVPRRALFDALSSVRGGQVVLLCAPAGSGKTVLLRSWMRSGAGRDPVAWVSVERDEEDAQHFWLSVIDALAGACRGGPGRARERDPRLPRGRRHRAAAVQPQRTRGARRTDHRRPPRAALARRAAAARALPRPDPADAARGALDASRPRPRPPSPAPHGRSGRDPQRRSAFLARGDPRTAEGRWDRAGGRDGGPTSRAHGGLGGRTPAGGDLARGAPGPRALRQRVLRQRTDRGGVPAGRGARAPAGRGS